ncbi:hypothetical protein PLICRDRAFT_701170 [Plicaturopsis crispa FD-325 SS-3]|nr:hypothetical protein PLICRDRAFT_701170 [Plicaturopsis crispa FD-325 SS-3]
MATTPDKLAGKKIVVIGGSSGIGFGVAKAAYALGAHVTISSSNIQKIEAAVGRASSVPSSGGTVQGVQLQGLDEASLSALFTKVGKFDHLIYTAADWGSLPNLFETPVEKMKDLFNVRFWGAIAAVKTAHPFLSQSGSITLTGGSVVTRPPKGFGITVSCSGALETLTRGLAVDLAPIRVNVVEAGAIRTEMWDNMPDGVLEKLAGEWANKSLVKRMGEVEDTTETYLYLMKADFVTGTNAVVDGGSLLYTA